MARFNHRVRHVKNLFYNRVVYRVDYYIFIAIRNAIGRTAGENRYAISLLA
jgi:hypothetical protein